jgi:hypothetical protein
MLMRVPVVMGMGRPGVVLVAVVVLAAHPPKHDPENLLPHIDTSHPRAAANSSRRARRARERHNRIVGNGERLTTPQTAERMAGAASAFLGALTAGQRQRACYPFGDERREWSFLPARDRDGLPIGALDDHA